MGGLGAGGKAFGRQGDGAGEAAVRELQGKRSTMLGRQAPCPKSCH